MPSLAPHETVLHVEVLALCVANILLRFVWNLMKRVSAKSFSSVQYLNYGVEHTAYTHRGDAGGSYELNRATISRYIKYSVADYGTATRGWRTSLGSGRVICCKLPSVLRASLSRFAEEIVHLHKLGILPRYSGTTQCTEYSSVLPRS